jgi:hypothetical protein
MSEIIIREERHRQTALALIAGLDIKRPWRVTVIRYVKTRSNPQLALYWMWLKTIADDTGNDTEDLHDFMKKRFLAPSVIEIAGEQHMRWSTGKLSTAEMSSYMERVLAFAESDLGIILPVPEEQFMR